MEDGARRLERVLATHCAPVICGEKASNLVAVERSCARFLPEVLGKNLEYREMCSCSRFYHVLIFDRNRMRDYLDRDEHGAFLKSYGYQDLDFDGRLSLLAGRFEAYQKRDAEFPHEIGLFLEYPLCDIEGFISNGGKNAIECGYWKVYGDAEEARRTFRLYDRLKVLLNAWLDLGNGIPDWTGSVAVESL